MRTTVTIIGAGQAGLAMSRTLTDRSIDHVVIERGQTADSWRTQRWDSLRLLTPNWMTRLPGWRYCGGDPDGYMAAADVIDFLDAYQRSFDAPVRSDTEVLSVASTVNGYLTTTTNGPVQSRAVVVATGACSNPHIPAVGAELPERIRQLTSISYRRPSQVDDGRVLVVGASASGAQITDELRRSGREVTMAVGQHVRLPRTYRGMDIHWWMDAIGQLDERYDEVDDIVRARRTPSLQLVGSPSKRTLDLNSLVASGVELVGRLAGVRDGRAQFSGSLANVCAAADLKQNRLLDLIDTTVPDIDGTADLAPPTRPTPTVVATPRTELDLSEVSTVIWATGFRPTYPWLEPDLLDRNGAIRHDGGVMDAPGMYVLGLPFTRRRKSSFLDGVGPDAADLGAHLSGHLDRTATPSR